MALERIRSWIQDWTEDEVSWTLVLQIILLTIALGFFLMLFGAVLMSYSTRKYEAMTKFYEASRSVEQIRAEISAEMFEEMTKDRDFVDGLYHGNFAEGLYHGNEAGLKWGVRKAVRDDQEVTEH